jgi:hypothetical protein
MAMGPKPKPLDERFWRHVDASGDCWVWTGARSIAGYGKMRLSRPRQLMDAHRVSWELHNGPIPDGFLVLHRCDNPPCVRPEHLFLGTHADNAADKIAKGRARYVRGADHPQGAKTHCPYGHPYEGDNVVMDAGSRKCRTCLNARKRAAHRRR